MLNVVPGLGKTVGQALALHQNVDMVTFTGSTVVGKQMLKYAGESNMKVVMAECGGKAPQIVFADVRDFARKLATEAKRRRRLFHPSTDRIVCRRAVKG